MTPDARSGQRDVIGRLSHYSDVFAPSHPPGRASKTRRHAGGPGMYRARCRSAIVALAAFAGVPAALAQMPPPSNTQNPACTRLEAQLAQIDRGTVDPARADQIKRFEEASSRQQGELNRMTEQARRLGCQGGGFFSLFSGQNPQCTPLNQQIQQSRANLEKMLADLDRLQSGGAGDREAQRATVIGALAQNNCGPQYRQAANQQRGFFDTLFGGNRNNPSGPSGGGLFSTDSPSGTYRTVCVRTCDGYYFPISYATTPDKFAEDAQTCQATCPATETVLMSHRNPGEDMNQAVSASGAPYTSLANAFKYRTEVVPACSCRKAGQSWADALGTVRDSTLQQDDIVVTPERAKALSQPRDAQGRPIRVDTRNQKSAAPTAPAADSGVPPADIPKGPIRTVGPTFVPSR
jgi:uncharacterized protein DUF2865